MTDPPQTFDTDESVMRYALRMARRGIGYVEPNPAVGAVIVDGNRRLIAAGFHERFGEAHAEINALTAAGDLPESAQLFVTLEPCSHHGKTPPCADAVVAAGFRKVFVACQDPAPHVAGQGIQRLRDSGTEVEIGLCESEATDLIAPFRTLMLDNRPWVHAKWAMTLDGRIASRTGHSKWISNEESRRCVHQLRGRMDAIITGSGTVRADDPLLTPRPPGCRVPLRVVFDASGQSLSSDSQLVKTARETKVLLSANDSSLTVQQANVLHAAGVEIHAPAESDHGKRLQQLMLLLGQRQCTNVLIESGSGLLGAFFDERLIDEVHVFIAPKLVGGHDAWGPIGGSGLESIPSISSLRNVSVKSFGDNTLIEGLIS